MTKKLIAALALAGVLTLGLSGCAVTYPADPAPAAPTTASTSAPATTEAPTTAPEPAKPAGSSSNPIPVATDGSTVIDATTNGGEVFAVASANSSFEVVAGEHSIDGTESTDGLQIEETERGVRVTMLDDYDEQYLIAYDSRGIEFWVFINDGGL